MLLARDQCGGLFLGDSPKEEKERGLIMKTEVV